MDQYRSDHHSVPSLVTARLLSLCAFTVCLAVIPLAKTGKSGAGAFLVPLGLLLTTGLFLALEKRPDIRARTSIRRRLLQVLLVLFSGFVLVALYTAIFDTPVRVAKAYRYVIQKVFYISNKIELLLGLNDLLSWQVWSMVVGILFCATLLAFLVWLIRLRTSDWSLFAFCVLVAIGIGLGLIAPSKEFRVSSSAKFAQLAFHVIADREGDFVTTWQSKDQDGSGWGIYARRYFADGTPKGDEFQVNTYTSENQFVPRIGMDNAGNFAIVWESKGQDGDSYGIYCQRYSSDGLPIGESFQVNTTTTSSQHDPFIAMMPGGDLVVTWVSDGQDGDGAGIYGQKFDALGKRLGEEFHVNTFTAGHQKKPIVSSSDDGSFAIVWESDSQDGSGKGVFFRQFDATGNPIGNELQANTFTTDDQTDGWIEVCPNGNFVVAWSSAGQDGSGTGIFARLFDPRGNPLGGEFQVNTFTDGNQRRPAISSDADGNFVVVWESADQDSSGLGIYGRSFDASGNPRGGEFQTNIYTTDQQFGPTVTHTAQNRLIIFWTSFGQDGSTEGAYARIYADAITPE